MLLASSPLANVHVSVGVLVHAFSIFRRRWVLGLFRINRRVFFVSKLVTAVAAHPPLAEPTLATTTTKARGTTLAAPTEVTLANHTHARPHVEFSKLLCLSYEILSGAVMYINGSCQSGRESPRGKESAHLHKLDAVSKRSDARVTVELLVSYAWMPRSIQNNKVVGEIINDTRGYVCPGTTQDFNCLKSKIVVFLL